MANIPTLINQCRKNVNKRISGKGILVKNYIQQYTHYINTIS